MSASKEVPLNLVIERIAGCGGRNPFKSNMSIFGTVSRATLGRLLRDGLEWVWSFPIAMMPSWAETEIVN